MLRSLRRGEDRFAGAYEQARGVRGLPARHGALGPALPAREALGRGRADGVGVGVGGEAEAEKPGGVASAGVAPRVLWEKRIIPLVEGENVLGRDEGVTVRIDAPGVSRRHATVRVAGDRATIEDLGSKNGTYVGDATSPIAAPTTLPDDCRFRLGRVLLVFRSSPEAGSTLTEHHG